MSDLSPSCAPTWTSADASEFMDPRPGNTRATADTRNCALRRRPACPRFGRQHHAAVMNEIIEPLRGRDQCLRL